MKHNVLLIGLGNIGLMYDYRKPKKFILSHARAFDAHKDFKLVGGVDIEKTKKRKLNKIYKIPFFTNIKTAIKKTLPDIVVISTPTINNLKIIKNIFSYYKPKIIILEKPIAYSMDEAKKIMSVCRNNKCDIFVNYPRIINGTANLVKHLIKNKKNIICNILYSKGLKHNGSHFFNFIEFIFGKIEKKTIINIKKISQNDFISDFVVNTKKAKIFFISTNKIQYTVNSIEIFLDKLKLVYSSATNFISIFRSERNKLYKKYFNLRKKANKIKIENNKINYNLPEELSKFLRKKKNNLCPAKTAYLTLKNICDLEKNITKVNTKKYK
jgi:predicted dehydrogenase